MKYERKNKIMSKCPEELKGLLNIFGIDPESVEVHTFGVGVPDEMRYRRNRYENATTEAKKRAETASYNDAVSYLKHLGLSDEKIAEIMQEVEENKRKMNEAAEREKRNKEIIANNVVEMTLRNIAKAYGYTLVNAVWDDGTPHVEAIEKTDHNLGEVEPEIMFDFKAGGFVIKPSSVVLTTRRMAEKYLRAMNNAIGLCNALNQIDYQSWPNLERK